MGKYVKISETGHYGSSRGHDLVLRRRMVVRVRSTSSVMVSNVPNGSGIYQHLSGAFLSDLGRT